MKETVMLLEQLAYCAPYRLQDERLVSSLPQDFQKAFLTNNSETIKKKLSNNEMFAHESHVFQI